MLYRGQYLKLSEAAGLLPNNPAPSVLWRWITHGIRGVRLRARRFGRGYYTTREWLDQFGDEVARATIDAVASPTRASVSATSERREDDPHAGGAVHRAKQEADEAGL